MPSCLMSGSNMEIVLEEIRPDCGHVDPGTAQSTLLAMQPGDRPVPRSVGAHTPPDLDVEHRWSDTFVIASSIRSCSTGRSGCVMFGGISVSTASLPSETRPQGSTHRVDVANHRFRPGRWMARVILRARDDTDPLTLLEQCYHGGAAGLPLAPMMVIIISSDRSSAGGSNCSDRAGCSGS